MKKPSVIKRFFSFLLRLIVVVCLMAAIMMASFEGVNYYLSKNFYSPQELLETAKSLKDLAKSATATPKKRVVANDKDVVTTVHFVDCDGSYKQYMAISMYHKSSHAYNLLLVPANLQVTVSSDLLHEIRNTLPKAVASISLTDISQAYGDDKYQMISDILEETIGEKVDGYDIMTQKNFVKFLNVAGKVSLKIDNQMTYRDKNDKLHLIPSGQQSFDGQKAWNLMSYRDGKSTEESDRLTLENNFMTAFLKKALKANDSGIMKEYSSLLSKGSKPGDLNLERMYDNISPDGLMVRTLQGGEKNGIYTVDSQIAQLQVSSLVQQMKEFSAKNESKSKKEEVAENTEEASESTESSKDCDIELYNAAYVGGLAADWETYLEGEGYSISLIDSYQDEGPISTTRIVVKEKGMGKDLLKYFPDAKIETGDIDTGGDIRVYIGTDSTDVGKIESSDSSDSSDYDSEDSSDSDSDETYDSDSSDDSVSESEDDSSSDDESSENRYDFSDSEN